MGRCWSAPDIAAGRPPFRYASAAADFDPTAVSTDPDQLLAALRSGEVAPWSTGDDQTFLLIGDLLAQPGLSTAPEVGAISRCSFSKRRRTSRRPGRSAWTTWRRHFCCNRRSGERH